MLSPIKRSKMISKENAQIIFWQETHLTNQEHEKSKKMSFRHIYYSYLKTRRERGVAIMPNSVHYELGTTNRRGKTTNTERWVKRRVQDLGLIDVWRHFHNQAYSRIDYILMHNFERHKLNECEISQRDLSDHSTVHLKLHLDSRHKITQWRLNISMLNNPGFKKLRTN